MPQEQLDYQPPEPPQPPKLIRHWLFIVLGSVLTVGSFVGMFLAKAVEHHDLYKSRQNVILSGVGVSLGILAIVSGVRGLFRRPLAA